MPMKLVVITLANSPRFPCVLVFMFLAPRATVGLSPCCLVRVSLLRRSPLRFSDKHAIALKPLTGEGSSMCHEVNTRLKGEKTFQC